MTKFMTGVGLILLLSIAVVVTGCAPAEGAAPVSSSPDGVGVTSLGRVRGCNIYRFEDEGRTVYVSRSSGSLSCGVSAVPSTEKGS